ncbi:MAG: ASCH domain-containing protein [Phycisphaeraceae bacterium JB051]
MHQHIAILQRQYLDLILSGIKTVESRLTGNALAPFGKIQPGQRIYFKQSSGPFRATAIADKVDFYDNLTPAKLRKLYDQYNARVCGSEDYWFITKARAKYATFVTLRDVLPTHVGPAMKPSQGLAWFVIDPVDIPLPFAVTLTDGALKNGYISMAKHMSQLNVGDELTLHLPDDHVIQTIITPKKILQYRGWSRLFDEYDLYIGDRVIFEPVSELSYRVTFDIKK